MPGTRFAQPHIVWLQFARTVGRGESLIRRKAADQDGAGKVVTVGAGTSGQDPDVAPKPKRTNVP